MKALIDNLINGNLHDAKMQARIFSMRQIFDAMQYLGHSVKKSMLAARYLKTGQGWQAYCNAE